jgi:poly-gamma-glutamate synthesis protein (capsule biosynthesis protein)
MKNIFLKVLFLLLLAIVTLQIFLIFKLSNIEIDDQNKAFEVSKADQKQIPKEKKNKSDSEAKNTSNNQTDSEKAKDSYKFLFFGDMMLDRNVKTLIDRKGLDHIFGKIAGSKDSFFYDFDHVMANLEGAVTDNGSHYKPENAYDFAFEPETVNSLKEYNFNFFNLANNHSLDQGERGVRETYQNLEDLEFGFSGCPDGRIGDCSSRVIEKNGKKIGFAGFSMVYSMLNKNDLAEEIKELKEKSDLVVANIHWGVEYEHYFNKTQQDTAYLLIDSGADIVIGHHPHVVQGMEIYKSRPIFYSLGNFVFDQYFSQATQEGLSVGINWQENGDLSLFLFPFKAESGRLEFLEEEEERDFLKKFLNWSDLKESREEEILNGRMELILE